MNLLCFTTIRVNRDRAKIATGNKCRPFEKCGGSRVSGRVCIYERLRDYIHRQCVVSTTVQIVVVW